MWLKFGIPVVAAAALGFAVATIMLLNPQEQAAAPLHRPAVTTFSGPTVAGLGIIEPQSECISVGSPLTGIIAKVEAVPGQVVKKGDPLFTLDARELQAELHLRNQSLKLEEAKLARLQAGTREEDLPPAQHRVAAAAAAVEQARDQSDRAESLLKHNAISAEESRSRRFALQAAEAEYGRAESEYARLKAGTWDRDIEVAKRETALARAAVQRVEMDLERIAVRAPIDGIVLRVNVRPGEYVGETSGAEPLITLGDRGPLRVRVQVDEEDALHVVPNRAAEGYVRGRTRQRLDLKFVRIEPGVRPKQSFSGGTGERVDTRVLIVLYEIVAPQRPIYVGQQVDVFIASVDTHAS